MARRKMRRIRMSAGLAGVSKQDFEAVAKIFCRHQVPEAVARDLANYFGNQNPRFNSERFVAATRKC